MHQNVYTLLIWTMTISNVCGSMRDLHLRCLRERLLLGNIKVGCFFRKNDEAPEGYKIVSSCTLLVLIK